MRVEFERWLSQQNISDTVEEIFQEAITCYKAGAYRAALLLSYVGFLSVLRERILSTEVPPSGVSNWDVLLRDARNDDKWESVIFQATQRRPPHSIFDISDDVRQQVVYWKNRRNDCAHSKRNKISNAHVEAFWQFVESNLPKFVVRESRDSLLNKIYEHFDRSRTPVGQDCGYIVEQIPNAVEPDDIPEFLEKVYSVLEEAFLISMEEKRDFFARLLSLESVLPQVRSFLKTKEALAVEILRGEPRYVLLFSDDPRFIRRLWYHHLFRRRRDDLHLYCSLLRNRLIPVEEIEEAHRLVIERMPDQWPRDECFNLLAQTAFFEIFRDVVFTTDRLVDVFSWANYHTEMVTEYLQHFGIDEEIAHVLWDVFSKSNHPYDLKNALNFMFNQNGELKQEMLRHLAALELPVPKYLSALGQDNR